MGIMILKFESIFLEQSLLGVVVGMQTHPKLRFMDKKHKYKNQHPPHCSGHVKSSKQKQWLSHFLEVERHKCTWRQLRSSEDFIFDRCSTWLESLWQGFLSTLRQAFSLHLIFNQNLFDTFYSFYTFRSGVGYLSSRRLRTNTWIFQIVFSQ